MKKLIVVVIAAVALSGCAKTFKSNISEVTPVTGISSICIEDNIRVEIPLGTWIKIAANDNGYSIDREDCEAVVTYTALRYFDFHAPLAEARVTVKANGVVKGSLYFQQPANMFTGDKYMTPSIKILTPMLNELFEH
ncbi:hypothetical protein PE36_00260 [Moritella sp. PE36]|uniref:hypothetical protein n=1 Tax=Moritella sp. PE36 TaxID=58051 RepID=UPI00015693D0|nr:hypothetical protein [Moritella sp. PE36]EDM66183.1 hypothetical protein PE36_00260 [Moritella sp. PE36]